MLRAIMAGALTALVAALSPGVAGAAPGDIGVEAPTSYAPIGGSPTGSKPESKLWFNDGIWWATMFDPVSANHHIFKLDRQANPQRWIDTGTQIDTRDSTRADTLWDDTNKKLYVASHGFTTSASSSTTQNGRLWRYSYTTAGGYKLDTGAGFTAAGVPINSVRSETLTIDKDSNGRLWATWVVGGQAQVAATTGSDTQWSAPVTIGTGVSADDISSLIAFNPGGTTGPQIGVLWSNQVDHRFWFATHSDDGPDGQPQAAGNGWAAAAIPGTQSSDDHINLKTRNGTVYAAVKHSTSGTLPLTSLLVRTPAGGWSSHTFGTARDSHTRPIVLLDTANSLIRMFATGPQPPATSGQSGGDIVQKTSPFSSVSLTPSGTGTPVIRDNGSPEMNDVTSTKQNITAASGLVIMANNAVTKMYWHADVLAGGSAEPTPVPPPPPPPDLTADFTFTADATNPHLIRFDASTNGSSPTYAWSFGDGSTASAAATNQQISHTYSAAGTYQVTLTVTANGGATKPVTKSVPVSDAPTTPPPPAGTQTFTAVADSQVRSTAPTTKYGSLTTFRTRIGSSTDPTIYQSYIRFTVAGVSPGSVTSVKLRLFATDDSPDGGRVYAVANTWSESTITWDLRPPLPEPPIAPAGPAPLNNWREITLPVSAVPGDGTYNFGLASNSTNSALYSSREGANPPQLVITTS